MEVLKIVNYLPVQGVTFDNDIYFRIYEYLKEFYSVDTEFIKPVGYIPYIQTFFGKRFKNRREIFNKGFVIENERNFRINFFKCRLPGIGKLPYYSDKLFILEYAIFKRKIYKIVDRYKPNVTHAHNIFPDAYISYKLKEKYNIPYVVTLRGDYYKYYKGEMVKRILTNASFITTPSYDLFEKLGSRFNVNLLPHGIEDYWYNIQKKEFKSDKLSIVTTARLFEMKNIQVVLKAVAKLKKQGKKIEYDIIGEGPYKEKLVNLVNELDLKNEVRFSGWLQHNDLIKKYSNKHIFIMLSYPETFGRVFCEAAVQKLLIIGVKNTGVYGHLSEKEAIFVNVDENELLNILNALDQKMYYEKTERAFEVVKKANIQTINMRYYNFLKNASL